MPTFSDSYIYQFSQEEAMSSKVTSLALTLLAALFVLAAAPSKSRAAAVTITANVTAVGTQGQYARVAFDKGIECPGGGGSSLWTAMGSGTFGTFQGDEAATAARILSIANAALLSGRTVTVTYESTSAFFRYCTLSYIRIN